METDYKRLSLFGFLHTVEIQILFFSGFFFFLRLKKDHAIHQDQGFGI